MFFGNFYKLQEAEFLQGMTSLIQDKTVLYEAMIRDIYGLGAVFLGVTSFISVFIWILQNN